ncbi:hypothetical protein ACF3NG_08010 [Aerococcaceae bacterium WGS1372]
MKVNLALLQEVSGGFKEFFDNLIARPHNFTADQPGDVVQYVEAHDNLTLHDVIAESIKKDPIIHKEEIHARIRLANTMVLTSQGIAFIHAGQEYGRTKQFRHPDYKTMVEKWEDIPDNSTYFTDRRGKPIEYPYFIHDSYDASDAVNKFEWEKALGNNGYDIEHQTVQHMRGLIELRKSTDAFRLADYDLISKNTELLEVAEIKDKDVSIAYKVRGSQANDEYIIIINGNMRQRVFTLDENIEKWTVIGDQVEVNHQGINKYKGITINKNQVKLVGLTAAIFKK